MHTRYLPALLALLTASCVADESQQLVAEPTAVEVAAAEIAAEPAAATTEDDEDCGCPLTGDHAVVDDVLSPADRAAVEADDAPSWGDVDAPVTIAAFMDYDCSYCAKASAVLSDIAASRSDVRIVFRQHPLPFHARAESAARAALAAAEQDDFDAFHAWLFTNRKSTAFKERAAQLGLDATVFSRAMSSRRIDEHLAADRALVTRLGVRGAPTMFVNGQRIVGAWPRAKLEALIDAEVR